MNKRILKWLTIILPAAFWLLILFVSGEIFESHHSTAEIAFTSLLVTIGAIGFDIRADLVLGGSHPVSQTAQRF